MKKCKYPIYQPTVFYTAGTFRRACAKGSVAGVASENGISPELLSAALASHDPVKVAILAHSGKAKLLPNDRRLSLWWSLIRAEEAYLKGGCVTIFIEDNLLVNALHRSSAALDVEIDSVPFQSFAVSVPAGCTCNGNLVKPFLFHAFVNSYGERRVVIHLEEAEGVITGDCAVVSYDWRAFIDALKGGGFGKGDMADAGRIAAALCLYVNAEPKSLRRGFPDGIQMDELVYKGKGTKKNKVRAFQFAPDLGGKVERASCVVAKHIRYLRDPFYHHGETGKVKVVWVKAHSRGEARVTPYTAQTVPPLQG